MINRNRPLVVILFLVFAGLPLRAQEKRLEELLDLNMADLLNLKIVSALKEPETIGRVPATVRVITADDIRDNAYSTLEDALAGLPGLQFRNIQGFNSYIFMRGVPSQNNKILLLVDGVQVNELNSGGFYAGGQFNLANVDRIEVVYGPASALYGTNAVSGIINVFTRDPRTAGGGGQASLAAGSFGARQADVRYAQHDEKAGLGFSVSAMYKENDKTDLRGKEGDNNWTGALENFENDASFDGRVRYKDFSAGVMFQDKDASYATAQLGVAQPGHAAVSDHGVNWHIRFLNTWLTYAYDRKETWSLRSTAYYRNSTVQDDTIPIIEPPTAGSPGRQYRWYRPNHLLGSETQLRWLPSSRWRFSLGLVLEQERLAEAFSITESAAADVRPSVPADPKMLENRLISVYAQSQTYLTKNMNLFLGLRHDDSNYYGAVTTPRLGFVFNRGKLTAKALYMQAFRAPKPWDYTNGMGNPNLKPEKIYSLEASGGWSFSENLRLDLSVYRNRLDNLLLRINREDMWWWDNVGDLTTKGCEAGLEYRRGRLRAYLNYTYNDSRDDENRRVEEIAPHGANAGFQYAFTPAFRLSFRGQYLGERDNPKTIPATGNTRIDDALVVHSTLSLKLPLGFDLRLVVNNLLDAEYYHPSNLPASRFRQLQRSFRLIAGFAF